MPPSSDAFLGRWPFPDEAFGLTLGNQDAAGGSAGHKLAVADGVLNCLARTTGALRDFGDTKKGFTW
jgi:hypothetical protein